MFLGLVLTDRHGMEGGSAGSPRSNIGVHSKITDWAKVVTRYPYENVRMDYLLIDCALMLPDCLLVGWMLSKLISDNTPREISRYFFAF